MSKKSALIPSRKGLISPVSEDAESTYPLSEWMVPATDAHGHSAKIFTRCPPAYKHQIATILTAKRYPWDTESDLVRVAVHRLLEHIDKDMKNPEITSQQAMLNALVEMASKQMEYIHFKDALDKYSLALSELIRVRAYPVASKILLSLDEQIDSFEEEYWQTRCREVVDRYRRMIKEGQKGEKGKPGRHETPQS